MIVSTPMRNVAPLANPKVRYDFPTAVTFLLAGAALGGILTLLFSPLLPQRSSRDLDYALRGSRR